MSTMYVMRRANGDLFTKETKGRVRIPIWSSEDAVARYKAHNPELAVFLPTRLERSVLKKVTEIGSAGGTEFFLLSDDSPSARLFDGRLIKPEELFEDRQHSPI
jgi:hypothetical protein